MAELPPPEPGPMEALSTACYDHTLRTRAQEEHACLLGAAEFLYSGQRQHGERWACPECRKVWRHVCSEDAGCHWLEVKPRRAVAC